MRTVATSLGVGVPLTLLQLTAHQHTGVDVLADLPALAANNVLMAAAVYSADRIAPSTPRAQRLATAAAAAGSAAFFASDARTAVLAPVVVALHLWYAHPIKPAVAPGKPFFVAALWAVAVYAVPLWRVEPAAAGVAHLDATACAAFFLALAALSHAADIVDVDEDAAADVRTPAVLLGADGAVAYAFGLALAAALLDASAAYPHPVAEAVLLTVVFGVVFDCVTACAWVGAAVACAYAATHDYELVRALLRASGWPHHVALDVSTRVVEEALRLPAPWRAWVVEGTLALVERADTVGHAFLRLFAHAARDELRPR